MGRLLAVHADSFYRHGVSKAFELLGAGAEEHLILNALVIPLDAAGCGSAVTAAKTAKKNRARRFAKNCPAGEAAPLDYRRFRRSTKLSDAALAELLELRARERRIEDQLLHKTVVQLLLPELSAA